MRKYLQLILISLLAVKISSGQTAILCGEIKDLSDTAYIKCSFIYNDLLEPVKAVAIQVIDGQFYQQLEVKSPVFLSLAQGNNYYCGFIQPGDSIHISYDAGKLNSSLRFTGKGKENFSIPNRINELKVGLGKLSRYAKEKKWPVGWFFQKTDSIENKLLIDIRKARAIDKSVLPEQLTCYLAATLLSSRFNGTQIIGGDLSYTELMNKAAFIRPVDKLRLKEMLRFNDHFSGSVFYQRSVYNTLLIQYESDFLSESRDSALVAKYNFLKKSLPEKLRYPVCYLFLSKDAGAENIDEVEAQIKSIFRPDSAEKFRNILLKKTAVSRGLYAGAPAPDFTTEDLNGNKISLASMRGRVVYIDFWFATCTPCHSLFIETQNVKDHFSSDSNVVFLNISIDNQAEWKNATQKYRISGIHVFTEDKLRDHPAIIKYNVQEYPTTFLISKNGTIADTNPPHTASDLLAEIEAMLKTK